MPDFLLAREDSLDALPPSDQAMFRSHVTAAERVIGEWGLPRSTESLEAILQHHERLDGSGYPGGLKDKQIGAPGRILALADLYDELTSWRPHREPVTARAALSELRREAAEGRIDGPLVERLAVLLAPII